MRIPIFRRFYFNAKDLKDRLLHIIISIKVVGEIVFFFYDLNDMKIRESFQSFAESEIKLSQQICRCI